MDAPHLAGPRLPAPSETAAPIPRRLVVFEGGVPTVKEVPLVTPALVKDIQKAALAEIYCEPDDALAIELGLPPSEFYGRPLIEVMLIRQARRAAVSGESDLVEAILDRLMGKPKTTSENHNINESYEDALTRIGKAEEERRRAAAIDAEVVRADWEDLV